MTNIYAKSSQRPSREVALLVLRLPNAGRLTALQKHQDHRQAAGAAGLRYLGEGVGTWRETLAGQGAAGDSAGRGRYSHGIRPDVAVRNDPQLVQALAGNED